MLYEFDPTERINQGLGAASAEDEFGVLEGT